MSALYTLPSAMMQHFAGYTIVRRFPPSGMADVYVARSPHEERVILRCMLADFARQRKWRKVFLESARVMGTFDHDNVVRLLDVGTEDDTPYMVLEYVEAETLRTLISRRDPGLASYVIPLLRQMAEALYYVHLQGYLHLDFKPENLLVDRNGKVVLIDFDLIVPKRNKPFRLKKLPGTFPYLPRETLVDHLVEERTDIYAYGVTAYETVTGHQPYEGTKIEEVRASQTDLEAEPTRPSRHVTTVPAFLERLILKCLANHPEDRYPSMSLVLKALATHT